MLARQTRGTKRKWMVETKTKTTKQCIPFHLVTFGKSICTYSSDTFEQLSEWKLQPHEEIIFGIVLPDGRRIVGQCYDKCLRMFDFEHQTISKCDSTKRKRFFFHYVFDDQVIFMHAFSIFEDPHYSIYSIANNTLKTFTIPPFAEYGGDPGHWCIKGPFSRNRIVCVYDNMLCTYNLETHQTCAIGMYNCHFQNVQDEYLVYIDVRDKLCVWCDTESFKLNVREIVWIKPVSNYQLFIVTLDTIQMWSILSRSCLHSIATPRRLNRGNYEILLFHINDTTFYLQYSRWKYKIDFLTNTCVIETKINPIQMNYRSIQCPNSTYLIKRQFAKWTILNCEGEMYEFECNNMQWYRTKADWASFANDLCEWTRNELILDICNIVCDYCKN